MGILRASAAPPPPRIPQKPVIRLLRHNATGNTTAKVIRAIGLFGSMQALNILCGIVRVKCVALLIGTAGVGLFAIFNSAQMLLATTQLNLRSSAVRDIAKANSHSSASPSTRQLDEAIGNVRRWGWLLGWIGTAVTLISAPLFSLYTFGDLSSSPEFMLLAIAILLMAASAGEQAIMQGTDRLKPLAASSVWGIAAGLAVSIPLIYFLRMRSIVPVVISYAITQYIAILCLRSRPARPAAPIDLRRLWRQGSPMLRLGSYMTIAAILKEAINYVFIAFLNWSGGTDEVGIYQSGYTIVVRYMGVIFTAVAIEFYTRLASLNAYPSRQITALRHELFILTCIITPLLVMILPLSPFAVRLLYSSEFTGVTPYMTYALPGMLLHALPLCISYLILARGDGRIYVTVEALHSLLSLAMSIAGYRLGGLAGLGAAFTADNAAYAVIMLWVLMHRYRSTIPSRLAAIYLLSITAVSLTAAACM
ncbi:MAG: oligosaccharide flippase family protein [Muribaculaceae bacterium]|nr:oligosaccharide flippase family protein [Muribaculaceae bacterium]